jgi:predicted ferric reductase|tara:strand:+ start:162 stop:452 length:291 start_codon:yes stop_codon:yes gene_type:complete
MNKYLKFIVSFLAVLILILFSITIIVIIKKYSHVEDKYIENIEIFPKLNENESVQSFNINGNKLYLYVKNKSNNKTSIIIYNLKNSKKVGSIIIKD